MDTLSMAASSLPKEVKAISVCAPRSVPMLTSFQAGKPCSGPHYQLPPKVEPLFQPAQAEDTMFWHQGAAKTFLSPDS